MAGQKQFAGVYWAEDGRSSDVPEPVLRRHTPEDTQASDALFAVHLTDASFTGTESCQPHTEFILPCRGVADDVDISSSSGSTAGGSNFTEIDLCPASPGAAMNAWLELASTPSAGDVLHDGHRAAVGGDAAVCRAGHVRVVAEPLARVAAGRVRPRDSGRILGRRELVPDLTLAGGTDLSDGGSHGRGTTHAHGGVLRCETQKPTLPRNSRHFGPRGHHARRDHAIQRPAVPQKPYSTRFCVRPCHCDEAHFVCTAPLLAAACQRRQWRVLVADEAGGPGGAGAVCRGDQDGVALSSPAHRGLLRRGLAVTFTSLCGHGVHASRRPGKSASEPDRAEGTELEQGEADAEQ
ncbi:hypothetical protein ON010_g15952 [Phytophthora cinnamomi]|nr:hypothetical protein ON010_g15952 [Phytophthora cinnamomi]